jgi:antitoxin HicB
MAHLSSNPSEQYMAREFQIIVEPIPAEYGVGYVASVAELPDCMACGKTSAEAIARVSEAISAWKVRAAQAGQQIPRPLAAKKKVQHAAGPAGKAFAPDFPGDVANPLTDRSELSPDGPSARH